MGGADMSRRRMLTVGLMVVIAAVPRPVAAVVTGDQAERIALDAVERAAGLRGRITDREAGDSTWRLTVDGRWWVSVKASTGQVRLIGDRSFSESSRLRRKLDTPPTGGEIEKAGRELMAKVFPDLDMAEFTLERAEARAWSGCAEARWRQVISENGFPGAGWCQVIFGWPDHAIETIAADDQSILDEWRKPPTVTAEEAEEIARPKLGDLTGRWVETRKHFCGSPDAKRRGPVWDVMVLFGPENDHYKSCMDRSVYVDPWSGEITYTPQWDSAAPAGSTAVATDPSAMPSSAEVPARPWLPWAGGAAWRWCSRSARRWSAFGEGERDATAAPNGLRGVTEPPDRVDQPPIRQAQDC